MSLSNYAERSRVLAEELRASLSAAEIDTLREQLRALPIGEWVTWCVRHVELIAEFVAATPSERLRKKRWKSLRLHLTLAGIQHCQNAQVLLHSADRHALYPGGSYRSMAARAGMAHLDVMCEEETDWPFEGESPFAD